MALGQAERAVPGKLERAAFPRSFGHLARFYADALLTRSAREFEVGNIWLPVVDTFRTLVFQPGSFEPINVMNLQRC